MADVESGDTKSPAVFMSYAWDDKDHTAWVLNLAARLRAEGIDVVLDRWDAGLGSDLGLFMEQAGSLDNRVLAVVSDQYREKSDNPAGGVGYEKRIIAPTVMADLSGDRIVPVLRANDQRKLPRYMGAAKYIDFTDDRVFEDRLFELVHELHGRPILPKPPLGPNPFATGQTESQMRAEMRHRPDRYTNPDLSGTVTFNYSNNGGKFTIGSDTHAFTLHVSEAGHGSVYIYRDAANVRSVALVPFAADFREIGSGADHDASSRVRNVRVGDAAVLENSHNYWAAVLVDEVLTRDTSTTGWPSMTFRFRILPSKDSDFSSGAQ